MAPTNNTTATSRAIRGHIVSFKADPFFTDDFLVEYDDGVVVVTDGIIEKVGDYATLAGELGETPVDHYPGCVISAGFIDTHIHYVQMQIMAAFGKHLIDWLNQYVFPAEMEFKDRAHGDVVAAAFCDELLRSGTTSALVFAASYPQSVESLFQEAHRRNMRIVGGKVLMDRNAPEGLQDTAESAYADSKALIEKWHGTGRIGYAVTPRFAPTSTPAQLEAAGALLQEDPTLWMHTHLSEQLPECEWVHDLFPESRDYLDVYEQNQLVRERAVFAHSIHLQDREREVLHETGAGAAHCPTSNLFLGSGLFSMRRAKDPKLSFRVGLGSDIGAGTHFSQLATMGEAYKISNLLCMADASQPPINPYEMFFLATLGGAQTLYLDDKIGSIAPGKEADITVLDPHSSPLLKFRTEYCNTLDELLFVFATVGDTTTVKATYVGGALAYERDA